VKLNAEYNAEERFFRWQSSAKTEARSHERESTLARTGPEGAPCATICLAGDYAFARSRMIASDRSISSGLLKMCVEWRKAIPEEARGRRRPRFHMAS
jgi:hypothetical protein